MPAPLITGVSGTITNGSEITITGSDFGANGPTVHIFDDFESGTVGNNIRLGSGSATGGDGTEPYSGWALSCNDCFSTKMWFNTDFNMYKGRWYRVWAWIKATATPNTSRQDI